MVWFKLKNKNTLIKNTTKKITKKFKNGEPIWDYFGAGMYSNYSSIPRKHNMRAYEVFPTLKDTYSSLQPIATDSPRSFELYKHSDNDYIQLVIRSTVDDIESYAKLLNVDYKDTGLPIMPIMSAERLKNVKCFFFDFELEHQFNFSPVEQQKPIIDRLIRAMNVKGCGILVQFLFTTNIKWNSIASVTANALNQHLQKIGADKTKQTIAGFTKNFIPTIRTETTLDVRGRSSSVYTIGKKLSEHYTHKAQSTPISLSIRGMIIGEQNNIDLAIKNIASVFTSVIFVNDFLKYCDYYVDSDLAYDWLLNNDIANDDAIRTLENNQKMWSDMRWGVGRDFVPFLCLTPEEFSVFVSLPIDPTLPVSFRRQKIRSTNYDKMVFPLGTVL